MVRQAVAANPEVAPTVMGVIAIENRWKTSHTFSATYPARFNGVFSEVVTPAARTQKNRNLHGTQRTDP